MRRSRNVKNAWKPCSDERELCSGDKTGFVICVVRSIGYEIARDSRQSTRSVLQS
jgi:hypothetical protein